MQEDPEPVETTFELTDTLFARAKLEPIDRVHLWLGVSRLTDVGKCYAISRHRRGNQFAA